MPNNTFLKYSAFVISVVFAFTANAQTVTLKGNAPSFKKGVMELCTIDDYINGHELVLDTARIDNQGNFTFKPTVKQTFYSYLKQGDLIYELYLEPGENLEFIIPDTAGFAKDSILKPIVIANPKFNSVNQLINTFDAAYNDFLINNYRAILRKTARPQAQVFADSLRNVHKNNTNAFFKSYMEYRLGSLELLSSVHGRAEVLKRYFKDQTVQYNNPAYMDLLYEVFDKNLKVFRGKVVGQDLNTAINDHIDYHKAMEVMQRDSTIPNDTIRELALLKGLTEMYYEPRTIQYSVLEMLRYIGDNGLTAYSKNVAKNTVNMLEKLRTGTPAPAFKLRDAVNNRDYSLSDYKGKYVYLSFWDETNPRSIQEIDLIRELDKKYGKKIVFISICSSRDAGKLLSFINRSKYKWLFLNSYGNSKIVADYDVLSYPSFYLIDKEGNILRSPADRPSGNIVRTFDALVNPK